MKQHSTDLRIYHPILALMAIIIRNQAQIFTGISIRLTFSPRLCLVMPVTTRILSKLAAQFRSSSPPSECSEARRFISFDLPKPKERSIIWKELGSNPCLLGLKVTVQTSRTWLLWHLSGIGTTDWGIENVR